MSYFTWFAVAASPNMSALPGGQELQNLINGLDAWALLIALGALIVGAVTWAIGSHSQNYHQAALGKKAVMVSALAALIIGAAPDIVNFFYSAGQNIH